VKFSQCDATYLKFRVEIFKNLISEIMRNLKHFYGNVWELHSIIIIIIKQSA